ncbi:hypothetical protein PM082_013655 [Marasmius tenuissimus]|nr:hypothetical protein PM082_013655 [Marasmius tenuissimus]
MLKATVAFLVFLFVDTVSNLDQEYRYIWQRKWRFVEILYLCARYGTFLDSILAVYERLGPIKSTDCNRLMNFITIFSGTGVVVAEWILMIRTYAIFSSSRKILVLLVLLWLAAGGASYWAVARWGIGSFHPSAFPPKVAGFVKCYRGANEIVFISYMAILIIETVIVVMTTWKAYRMWWITTRNAPPGTSPLIASLYRDGIFFYCCLLPFTTLNMIALLRLPEGLLLIGDRPLRVVHTIAVCRLVIHVRQVTNGEQTVTGDIIVSRSIQFVDNVEQSEAEEGTSSRQV